MKSEFALAFNEIAERFGLPQDTVMEAVEAMMISAYRRSVYASSAQTVEVKIDPETGTVQVYAEKEVVETVENPSTEVSMKEARNVEPEAELEPAPEPKPELESKPAPVPEPEIDTTAEEIEINVKDLNAIYQTDKASAGAKLADKTLRVTGIVDRAVVNSGLDIYYVLLTSNEPKSWNVRCTFDAEHGTELRGLVKGHTVTVQGKYSGYERNILLKDCFLVR